ncbi:MAG: hypothetical protein ACTSSK_18220 [Candidatus Heimdallarchaeota archaeon]
MTEMTMAIKATETAPIPKKMRSSIKGVTPGINPVGSVIDGVGVGVTGGSSGSSSPLRIL